tara:strand:+ start:1005 stop:1328 length:324 start_codon:yes stop_codon:yes gene_type:complete
MDVFACLARIVLRVRVLLALHRKLLANLEEGHGNVTRIARHDDKQCICMQASQRRKVAGQLRFFDDGVLAARPTGQEMIEVLANLHPRKVRQVLTVMEVVAAVPIPR